MLNLIVEFISLDEKKLRFDRGPASNKADAAFTIYDFIDRGQGNLDFMLVQNKEDRTQFTSG